MERLTLPRNSDGSVSQPTYLDWEKVLSKLTDYEDAEERGLLVPLPCKVGDTVYRIETCPTGRKVMGAYPQYRVRGLKVSDIYKEGAISFYASNIYPGRGEATSTEWFNSADIGKTIFLSREEAEAALKGKTDG